MLKGLIKNCLICGKLFKTCLSRIKQGHKYCSCECYGISRKGIKKPWISKINSLRVGRLHYPWKVGISKDKKYKLKYHKEYRHRIGESIKYFSAPKGSGKGISYTKNYRRLNRKKYKYSLKNAGQLPINRIQMVYEDNIKKYGTLTCYLCLKFIEFGKDHLEHKIPLSRGGTNEYNNLAIACNICNCKKHNKTEVEYRKEIELYGTIPKP